MATHLRCILKKPGAELRWVCACEVNLKVQGLVSAILRDIVRLTCGACDPTFHLDCGARLVRESASLPRLQSEWLRLRQGLDLSHQLGGHLVRPQPDALISQLPGSI